jgi:hypothetical protein
MILAVKIAYLPLNAGDYYGGMAVKTEQLPGFAGNPQQMRARRKPSTWWVERSGEMYVVAKGERVTVSISHRV